MRDRAPGLVTAALLVGLLAFLVHGILTMDVPPGADSPGPKVFPMIVTCATALMLVAQVIDLFRPEPPSMKTDPSPGDTVAQDLEHTAPGVPDEGVNLRALLGVVLAILVFSLLLEPLGWLISAAALFTGIALLMGARSPLTALGAGLAIASAIQLAFGAALGLNLPAGILEGVF